jgi:hypothetical protein
MPQRESRWLHRPLKNAGQMTAKCNDQQQLKLTIAKKSRRRMATPKNALGLTKSLGNTVLKCPVHIQNFFGKNVC